MPAEGRTDYLTWTVRTAPAKPPGQSFNGDRTAVAPCAARRPRSGGGLQAQRHQDETRVFVLGVVEHGAAVRVIHGHAQALAVQRAEDVEPRPVEQGHARRKPMRASLSRAARCRALNSRATLFDVSASTCSGSTGGGWGKLEDQAARPRAGTAARAGPRRRRRRRRSSRRDPCSRTPAPDSHSAACAASPSARPPRPKPPRPALRRTSANRGASPAHPHPSGARNPRPLPPALCPPSSDRRPPLRAIILG